MFTTIALVAALASTPAQAAKVDVANAHFSYWLLGMPRPDNKFLLGDNIYLVFDIVNLKADESGRVYYSLGMDVIDSKGMSQFKQEPADMVALTYLGGNRVAASAHVQLGLDFPPGTYTLKVTITDRAAKTSKTIDQKFEVLPMTFGIIRMTASLDREQKVPAPQFGVPGQIINYHFVVIGFTKTKPHIKVETQILDEGGKPTLAKPFVIDYADLQEGQRGVDLHFQLALNRSGKFTVVFKATDAKAPRANPAVMKVPITVLAAGK